jgi:hypothetical protein
VHQIRLNIFFFCNKIALKHKSIVTTLQGGKKTEGRSEGGSTPLQAEKEEEKGGNMGMQPEPVEALAAGQNAT